MYKIVKPLFLICQTPMHAGSGADLGIVDLPIQRERHTSTPKIESSSLKGALREAVEQQVNSKAFLNLNDADVKIHRIFGYDDGGLSDEQKGNLNKALNDKKEFAGAIGFTDARLLLFPVKSMRGVFAWITCPRVLKQFISDMGLSEGVSCPVVPPENTTANGSSLFISSAIKKVILEEYTFELAENDAVGALGTWLSANLLQNDNSYWSGKLKTDIVVLPDDEFKDFVNLSTEVITRTKIDNETGTVANGQLFTEEYLPAESIMYTMIMTHDEFRKESDLKAPAILDFFTHNLKDVVQIGGNATLGKGLVKTCKSFLTTKI